MKLSTSITSRPVPGPAPARHARRSAWPSTRSSWRTCPNENERRNVPSVDGAIGRCPRTASVRPARPRRPRPCAEPHGRINERLDPQPPPELDREHDPGVDDHALVIKNDLRSVRQILHHEGDLLTQAAVAPNDSFLPAQEVISLPRPDGPPLHKRRIEAKSAPQFVLSAGGRRIDTQPQASKAAHGCAK